MKMTATAGDLMLTIESDALGDRPTITGELYEIFKGKDLEWWTRLVGQPSVNIWPEIDFALALSRMPGITTSWDKPIIYGLKADRVY
jgi:hypothetical protein